MERFCVEVRRPVEFLDAVIQAFCGTATISFEGDLEMLRSAFPTFATDETGPLRRNTISPRQDFIVLPLAPEVVTVLRPALRRIGLRRRVLHVQIEDAGQLAFGAFDGFGPSTVWVSGRIGAAQIQALQEQGAISSYSLNPDAG